MVLRVVLRVVWCCAETARRGAAQKRRAVVLRVVLRVVCLVRCGAA